jgi:hypothetical protein
MVDADNQALPGFTHEILTCYEFLFSMIKFKATGTTALNFYNEWMPTKFKNSFYILGHWVREV